MTSETGYRAAVLCFVAFHTLRGEMVFAAPGRRRWRPAPVETNPQIHVTMQALCKQPSIM